METTLDRLLHEFDHRLRDLDRNHDSGSPYEIGRDIVAIVSRLAESAKTQKLESSMDHLRRRLAAMYNEAETSQRRCIVDGIVEHLFEVPSIEQYFENWATDPQLSPAYQEAKEWASALEASRSFLSIVFEECRRLLRQRGIEYVAILPFTMGSDVMVLEWKGPEVKESLIRLAVEYCGDLGSLKQREWKAGELGRVAEYVLDDANWARPEPWDQERRVTIPSELLRGPRAS